MLSSKGNCFPNCNITHTLDPTNDNNTNNTQEIDAIDKKVLRYSTRFPKIDRVLWDSKLLTR